MMITLSRTEWPDSGFATQVRILAWRGMRAELTDWKLVFFGLLQPVVLLVLFSQVFRVVGGPSRSVRLLWLCQLPRAGHADHHRVDLRDGQRRCAARRVVRRIHQPVAVYAGQPRGRARRAARSPTSSGWRHR